MDRDILKRLENLLKVLRTEDSEEMILELRNKLRSYFQAEGRKEVCWHKAHYPVEKLFKMPDEPRLIIARRPPSPPGNFPRSGKDLPAIKSGIYGKRAVWVGILVFRKERRQGFSLPERRDET
jgi:hypothetical protein